MPNQRWRDYAPCRTGEHTEEFFAPFDPETGKVTDEDGVLVVRERHCKGCPVRKACLGDIAEYEQGTEAVMRSGVVAYLTPGQREAAEKRGILRCPRCDSVRDPVLLAQGILRCPRRCGHPNRKIPPLPFEGDQWTKRHTTLGQRIAAWIADNTRVGDAVPTPTRMAELLGGIRRSDVLRVYQALVDERVLDRDDQRYTRVRKSGALREWYPAFLPTDGRSRES